MRHHPKYRLLCRACACLRFYPNEDGTNQSHIEIPFDDFMDPASVDNITAQHGGRVPGTGIKSLSGNLLDQILPRLPALLKQR